MVTTWKYEWSPKSVSKILIQYYQVSISCSLEDSDPHIRWFPTSYELQWVLPQQWRRGLSIKDAKRAILVGCDHVALAQGGCYVFPDKSPAKWTYRILWRIRGKVMGNMCRFNGLWQHFDLTIGQDLFTLANTSKPQYSCFFSQNCLMSGMKIKNFEFVLNYLSTLL